MSLDVYENNNKNANYHLGRLFMDCMRSKPEDGVCQIDAATEQQETYGSVLSRSIRLARSLRNWGLKPGDVLALGARNHLDLHIPYYAALLNGLPIVGVDPYFKYDEIKVIFKLTDPKIAFCDPDMYGDYVRAAKDLGIDVKIVSFYEGDCTMNKFIEDFDENNTPLDDFQPADFDLEKVFAWLVSTSGTTGMPKVAAFKHRALINQIITFLRITNGTDNGEMALNLSPVQWISGFFNAIGLILKNNITVQTSTPDSTEHIIDIINKYKPISIFTSPSLVNAMLKNGKPCDMTCFSVVTITGSKIYKELVIELKTRLRTDAVVLETYGQTETIGPVLLPNPRGPIGCCGVAMPGTKVKLVDPDTGKEVTEPHVPGEMWVIGPRFAEYYNNPVETAKAFSEDGYFKTGDLLYRDEENNFFFVDRIKMLIKYKNYHILPPELEEVIDSHPGVFEVAVTGVPHAADGQRAVACVVRRAGVSVNAQELKQLVSDKLSDSKQLRGGVIFLDELPKTSTGKVAYAKLKEIALTAHRE